MATYGFDETFQKNWFGKGREYSFEDDSFVGPDDHDKVLRQIYGAIICNCHRKTREISITQKLLKSD